MHAAREVYVHINQLSRQARELSLRARFWLHDSFSVQLTLLSLVGKLAHGMS